MTQRQRRRNRRRKSHKARPFLLSFAFLGGGTAIVALCLTLWVLQVAGSTHLDSQTPINEGTNSVIYASDGSRLGYIQSDTAREPVTLNQIPKKLQEATIAIEDRNFYKHGGIDTAGIVRAAVADAKAGKAVQGGSTITQQLVRNIYAVGSKRDITRKIKEAKLAEDLEALQGLDPGAVPQRRLLRNDPRAHRRRRRGRRAHFLLQGRPAPGPCRDGVAGRAAAGTYRIQPVPQPDRRAGAPQRGDRGHGQAGLHHSL